MASSAKYILALFIVVVVTAEAGLSQKYFPDDPIQAFPPPLPVDHAVPRDIEPVSDFLKNSLNRNPRPPVPASAVNTLGNVPDSDWFTNRHERRRMSIEELQRGAGTDNAPIPPFVVIGGKLDGISVGFRMKDSVGRKYFVKADPVSHPEMMTATEVIVSKFFYALGYNTPENYIFCAKRSDFRVSSKAELNSGRPMTWDHFEDILRKVPERSDGSYRFVASLAVEGESIGPFRYEGTRGDDPNDTIPHENRRDLRGLFVMASWLNHTDVKATNTLDTIIQNEFPFVRHYLIDFGSALGSDGDMAKDARFGHEFMLPTLSEAVTTILKFGLFPEDWERAKFPHLDAAGHFQSKVFDPQEWKTDYPNPAFLSRLPDDEFWGAKLVMAFNDEDIRAIVETGQYSDYRVTEYMTQTLINRREKIGKAYFSKLLALDHFEVRNGELVFEDLAAKYGFQPPAQYGIGWFELDNTTQQRTPLLDGKENRLPQRALTSAPGTYFSARIESIQNAKLCVWVDIRKTDTGFEVVGIERSC